MLHSFQITVKNNQDRDGVIFLCNQKMNWSRPLRGRLKWVTIVILLGILAAIVKPTVEPDSYGVIILTGIFQMLFKKK